MKALLAALSLVLVALPASAQIKPCEELKAEIAAKIEANGVAAQFVVASPLGDRRLRQASSRPGPCVAAVCCTRSRTNGPHVASRQATAEREGSVCIPVSRIE